MMMMMAAGRSASDGRDTAVAETAVHATASGFGRHWHFEPVIRRTSNH